MYCSNTFQTPRIPLAATSPLLLSFVRLHTWLLYCPPNSDNSIYIYLSLSLNMDKLLTTHPTLFLLVFSSYVLEPLSPAMALQQRTSAYVPPRARHCVTCSACILRRERHCALTACCVGHHNLRFAVGLSLHALAASLHSLLLSLGYLVERDGPLNLHALPGYVWPAAVWRYAHGWESITDLVVCILANMHAMHCVVCAPALAFQLVLASDGQTAHEAQAGVNMYDLGCLDNLHQVFGQNLILPFLFPVAAPIYGDGIECIKVMFALTIGDVTFL
uniref:Palmitoyltransferase n=1 Tax=Eptatretus burgeri TaxID=7764 RepID=A0A8C4QTD6_EPTBU